MAKSFRDQVKKLNEDLKKDLANMPVPKKRITTFIPSHVHDDTIEQKKRRDRQKTKRDLKTGRWED